MLDETHLGYPHHRWLAVGHLAEAESECLGLFPALASEIRACRLIVMQSHDGSRNACIEELIRKACFTGDEDDIEKYEDPNNSKKFDLVLGTV